MSSGNCDNTSNNHTMAEDLVAQSAAEGFEFDGQERHPRCMPCTVHFTALVVSQLTNTRAKVAMRGLGEP